jgi:hypothetical protein
MQPDNINNPFDIGKNLIIPESQDGKPLRVQPLCPLFIPTLFLRMLSTVSLDNDSPFVTDKISDETTNLLLSPEFQTLKLSCLKVSSTRAAQRQWRSCAVLWQPESG